MTSDKVELLSVSLLDEQRARVNEILDLYKGLELGLGWHYLLDISWAMRELGSKRGDTVLDAGAGVGIIQWWLAQRGVNVISVDLRNRADLDVRFRNWAPIKGLRPEDLRPLPQPGLRAFLPSWRPWRWHQWPGKLADAMRRAKAPSPPSDRGTITLYTQDLTTLRDVPDNTVDAVVSISALEHNTPDGLRKVVRELLRVLKPGGKLIATLGAAKDKDWFHEPSHGWNYTDATLKDIFGIAPGAPSNYAEHDRFFAELRSSEELKSRLDPYYSTSGDNGMPWGVWDPKYLTVGVVKTKVG
jgi:ubiquinone/menaquinone biosynthesis C-methylase UbiE